MVAVPAGENDHGGNERKCQKRCGVLPESHRPDPFSANNS